MNNVTTLSAAGNKTIDSPRFSKRLRVCRSAAFVTCCGFCLLLCLPTVVRDYAYGLIWTNGVFIPNSVYVHSDSKAHTILHTFRLFNLRSKPLTVSIEPSCGCVGVSWRKTTVLPFGWCSIDAEMEVHKPGEQQNIAFHTSDPRKSYLFAFLGNK